MEYIGICLLMLVVGAASGMGLYALANTMNTDNGAINVMMLGGMAIALVSMCVGASF